ncbi:hypothetical protein IWW54_001406 [Coemansia sp. RSA 2705]|nr:hypothetical protein IWW54_001406 [Coemansia sp. RSA 2705]
MTALYPRLSLKHVYYNCFKGFEFLPAIIASGIFNIIIGPAYTILIWRFKDAYGIQRSMTTTFAIGIIAWVFTLAWRLNDRWTNRHISATLVYESQLLFAHIRFIVIPAIKSIRFHRLQKRAHHDTQRIREDSFLGDVGSDRLAAAQTSKQSFMVALQNAHEHQKIERFAETCFCAELMSFLDVYLALKSSIYHEVLSSATTDLVSLDVGIVETIGHAFPQYGASYSTPVSDSLRDKVDAVVNTFILPDSPWEINLSSRLVEQSQEFVDGGPMPCGLLDEIKNEVVDLLYSNVYIRYRQSQQ